LPIFIHLDREASKRLPGYPQYADQGRHKDAVEKRAKKLMNDYPKCMRQKILGAASFVVNGDAQQRAMAKNPSIPDSGGKIKSAVLA